MSGYRSKGLGGFDPFNPLPPSSPSPVSFSIPAAIGGAALGYVWCTSGCVWAPVAAGGIVGVGLPMLVGASTGRYQTDVLWGGLLGAAAKVAGMQPNVQYGGVVVGALLSEWQQGTL